MLHADVVIRRPTLADGPAIQAMFSRCSLESRYGRFLSPLVKIPTQHMAQILTPAPGDEAWVGVVRDDPATVVALGSWTRGGAEAELALIVEDSWQRRGIGSALLGILGERARRAGVCRLTAWVLRESRHVFRMLQNVLGQIASVPDGPVSHVTIDRCKHG